MSNKHIISRLALQLRLLRIYAEYSSQKEQEKLAIEIEALIESEPRACGDDYTALVLGVNTATGEPRACGDD